MLTPVLPQVDQLARLPDTPQCGLQDGLRLAHERDHGTVMIRVHFLVQQADRPVTRNFGNQGLN
jgi:hypothetical protein